jgi:hypothetical protein
MKRPNLEILFGATALHPPQVVTRLLAVLLDELGGYLSRYYARMEFDPEDDTFFFDQEVMDLHGRDDLVKRVARDGSGRFSCDVNLGFYPATISPGVFVDPPGSGMTTCLAMVDGNLVRFLEESDRPRVPFITFCIRLAKAIGAEWFIGGLEFDHWRSVSLEVVSDKDRWPPRVYAAAWREGALSGVPSGRAVPNERVRRSIEGFAFLEAFPDADAE